MKIASICCHLPWHCIAAKFVNGISVVPRLEKVKFLTITGIGKSYVLIFVKFSFGDMFPQFFLCQWIKNTHLPMLSAQPTSSGSPPCARDWMSWFWRNWTVTLSYNVHIVSPRENQQREDDKIGRQCNNHINHITFIQKTFFGAILRPQGIISVTLWMTLHFRFSISERRYQSWEETRCEAIFEILRDSAFRNTKNFWITPPQSKVMAYLATWPIGQKSGVLSGTLYRSAKG